MTLTHYAYIQQALQFKIADMVTDLTSARTMLRLAASKIDTKAPDLTVYCAMAKRLATDAGFQVYPPPSLPI